MAECLNKYKDAEVVVNFASLRSAYDSTVEIIQKHPQVSGFKEDAREELSSSLPYLKIVYELI